MIKKGVLRWVLYVALVATVVVVVATAFPFVYRWIRGGEYFTNSEYDPGAVFDGISAFFSAVAFGLLILTILLQGYELSLQRRELKDTRKVLTDQARTLSHQQFDSTFFSMISLHNEIVRSMLLVIPPEPQLFIRSSEAPTDIRIEGRQVLAYISRELALMLESALGEQYNDSDLQERAVYLYGDVFNRHRDLLGHYFRNLYHIVKFVDRHADIDQKQYTSLIRAQLSGTELKLLFYNGLSEWGEGFDVLISKYALLEHLVLGWPVKPHYIKFYPKEVYGNNKALMYLYSEVLEGRLPLRENVQNES